MGMLIEGAWRPEPQPTDSSGRFQRGRTRFRNWITADGSSRFPAAAGRYHLYVSLACPWAHRTVIMRRLMGLEEAVSLSVVHPHMGEEGWVFEHGPGTVPDTVNGKKLLREVYLVAQPDFTGRVTVPVLWDRETAAIVNNESAEIMRMFDTVFAEHARQPVNFYPAALQGEIAETIAAIYAPINNGVYRAGFATTQAAYEEAVSELFAALDHWDNLLGSRRYLCGAVPTEADVCLFTTLVRFDPVYHYHFKCNLRRVRDYPNLWGYLRDMYQLPGVAETCNFDHIKQHYFGSHRSLNPLGIVPLGPPLGLDEPHGRATAGPA